MSRNFHGKETFSFLDIQHFSPFLDTHAQHFHMIFAYFMMPLTFKGLTHVKIPQSLGEKSRANGKVERKT